MAQAWVQKWGTVSEQTLVPMSELWWVRQKGHALAAVLWREAAKAKA
jgi:hypothetical protein